MSQEERELRKRKFMRRTKAVLEENITRYVDEILKISGWY
jgi:hypothetical protein